MSYSENDWNVQKKKKKKRLKRFSAFETISKSFCSTKKSVSRWKNMEKYTLICFVATSY